MQNNQTHTFRPAQSEDDERVLAFLRNFDQLETGQIDSDMEDLHFDWSEIDLARDTCIAFSPNGSMQAYSAIVPWGPVDLRYQIYDDLTQTDDELWGYMANFCQGRTLEMIAENAKHTTRAVTHFSHCNTRYRNLLENFGFKLSRYVFQMKISLEEAPNIPALPQGYRFGKFRLAQDEHTVHELIQQVFAEPSREPQSFEDWKAFMMRPNLFNPDLWHLIWFGEDLVGVCLPVPYPELGWIRQLGVAEKHRRKGLGRTLLLAGFKTLHNAGYGQAGLAVNSKNSNAHPLYISAGMTLRNQIDEYEKKFTD